MSIDSPTSVTQQETPNSPLASSTQTINELPDTSVREALYVREVAKPADSGNSQTAVPGGLASSPTLASAQSIAPSVKDALSTSFIDVRTVGVETWPIRGLLTWEGRVIDVLDEVFTAELRPLDDDSTDELLRADFRNNDLDLDLSNHVVSVGDLFYMTARKVRIRGRLSTSYSLQLRRPGNWTDADVADISARARARLNLLEENVE